MEAHTQKADTEAPFCSTTLSAELIRAVKRLFNYPPKDDFPPSAEKSTTSEQVYQNSLRVSLAIAYANLLADDLESVTEHHINILRPIFSEEEIHELTSFILELLMEKDIAQ